MTFVFMWIILYGGTHIISQLISEILHTSLWVPTTVMLLYVILFLMWIFLSGHRKDIGLCITQSSAQKEYVFWIPLLVLPIFNICIQKEITLAFSTIIYMICVSVVEEIFFRGFMLCCLIKKSRLYGIVISSLVFAIFHFVNLFQCQNYIYVILQFICAFVVGICYAAIVVQYHSLLPCLIAHALTNITGIPSVSSVISFKEVLGLGVCIMIYTIYGIVLCRKNIGND